MFFPSRTLAIRPRAVVAFAIAALTLLSACGGDDDSAVDTDGSTTTQASAEQDTGSADSDDESAGDAMSDETSDGAASSGGDGELTASDDLSSKPVISIGGDAPSSLETIDIVVGDGAEATAGSLISVQYVGVLFNGGTEFDSSWDRGQPFDFPLGAGQVIQGWDDGFEGMKVGGRRLLSIPSEMAYGVNGSGSGSIGPNEPLVFAVDLIDVLTIEGEKPEAAVETPLPDTLEIVDEVEGTGDEVQSGDSVTLHYVGVSASTGEEFDASWDRGTPFSITVGVGQVIPGWDQGLLGMKVGGQRRLTIPPDLAYGEAGAGGGIIAPNETLVFVVNLYKIG